MITRSTLDFLADLKANNNREWFEDNRPRYQRASADFFDTVAQFIQILATFDDGIAEVMPDPKSCIMRIYRDVRFSKDKTPYKTGLFAYVSKGGRKRAAGGLLPASRTGQLVWHWRTLHTRSGGTGPNP